MFAAPAWFGEHLKRKEKLYLFLKIAKIILSNQELLKILRNLQAGPLNKISLSPPGGFLQDLMSN